MSNLFEVDTKTFSVDSEIRALTWKEPFATLMLRGKIETRTWSTKVRGWVLICSGMTEYTRAAMIETCGITQRERVWLEIVRSGANINMNRGNAIAIGKLVDCRLMTPADEDKCFVQYREPWLVTKKDKHGKEYQVLKKLYCHIYEDVHPIQPFAWEGAQGWKILEMADKKKIVLI